MKSRFTKPLAAALSSKGRRRGEGKFGSEKGQAVVFASFFAVALLILGGVTVDTAYTFLRKSQLQRAVDASAMAGITRYWTGIINEATIENSAAEICRYNLRQMGVQDSQITSVTADLTVDANQVATLVVVGTLTVPTFFMRLIPGTDLDTVTVSTSSSSRRNPAILSLVLDTSGSMNSPPSKFQALKDAANTFIDSFENNLDQMAIVRFSDNVTIPRTMALVNKTQLHNAINALTPGGWTHISEAVAQGRMQIESANNPDAVKVIVLFTDGAPNVFRGYFTSVKNPPLTKNYPYTGTATQWSYSLFAAEDPITVKHPNTLSVKCTGQSSANVSNCFNSLAYKDSRFNVRSGSGTISRTSRSAMRKECYHLAVLETDYAKEDGVTIYTIGLGTPAAEGSDVYQNVDNDQDIKSYFLKRIANDPAAASQPQFTGLPYSNNYPAGIYFQTPNPADLTSLFEAVARRIKLRLVA